MEGRRDMAGGGQTAQGERWGEARQGADSPGLDVSTGGAGGGGEGDGQEGGCQQESGRRISTTRDRCTHICGARLGCTPPAPSPFVNLSSPCL